MRLLFNLTNQEILEVQLIKGKKIIDETHLTTSQGLDSMLISTLDKLLRRNRIDGLSLKSAEIRGKVEPNRLSTMILRSVASALSV